MDKKIYEKTRYQNIYRHKKNKNYVIMMSKPVKTSISRIDGKKILDTDTAIKVRDNIALKKQKANETLHKESLDILWEKYMFWCHNVRKLSYNTVHKKKEIYNKYFKEKIDIPLSKTTRDYWSEFLNNQECSPKQKNEILKLLKAFFNWCIEEEYIITNPTNKIVPYKITKTEMKYWLPNQLKLFLDTLEKDINSNNKNLRNKANIVKVLTIISFSLGDRIGETRALTFGNIDESKKIVTIAHSIDYDPNSKHDVSHTKNYHSQRTIDITDKLIEAVKEYRKYLSEVLNYEITDKTLILYNHINNKPYSDTALRQKFYYYCDKANVPKIRMYDLRHTYVATMMAEGIELYKISERVGHSNINTTVSKYGHLSNEVRKEVAKTTDKYL